MDDLFQRPLGPISIILNFSKKILVKADIKQLLPKKILRSFDENWRNTSLIRIQWVILDLKASVGMYILDKQVKWILAGIH